jgi:hypothetical protein
MRTLVIDGFERHRARTGIRSTADICIGRPLSRARPSRIENPNYSSTRGTGQQCTRLETTGQLRQWRPKFSPGASKLVEPAAFWNSHGAPETQLRDWSNIGPTIWPENDPAKERFLACRQGGFGASGRCDRT